MITIDRKREWTFRVSCLVSPGEKVFVVGSCEELGSWQSQKGIPLEQAEFVDVAHTNKHTESIWQATVSLPLQEISYRYYVCSVVENGSDPVFYSVRRWETSIKPRKIFKDATTPEEGLDKFGFIGQTYRVDKGWLIKETLVQLRLSSSSVCKSPVVLWKKKHKGKKCFVKATPMDVNAGNDLSKEVAIEESTEVELTQLRCSSKPTWPLVEVAVLKEGKAHFNFQDQFGVECIDDDFIVFRSRVMHLHSTAFLMDFYVELQPGEIPQYIGCSFVMPSHMKDSLGVAVLPITSPKHVPIGELTVQYMLAYPLADSPCNMKVSYAKHWKMCWRGLEVGHRGAGNSFHKRMKNQADIRENTVASLKYAHDNGADMVEFDVQISKDLVPVLYHDFYACISLKCKNDPSRTDLLKTPIKDLTLDQLQRLKVYHLKEEGISKFENIVQDDHQPFPTLVKVLNSLPESLSYNVELKWTMRKSDGSYELEHPYEMNLFVDTILSVLLKNAGSRKIVFSSFHPDICTLIRVKQNKYPVLHLTEGIHVYDDYRTQDIANSVYFATSEDILGINTESSALLANVSVVDTAFKENLVLFCYGDDNSDRDTIIRLKELGLHGIIYDKIDEHNANGNKPNVFLCEELDTCNCLERPHTGVSSPETEDQESDNDCKNVSQKRKRKDTTSDDIVENNGAKKKCTDVECPVGASSHSQCVSEISCDSENDGGSVIGRCAVSTNVDIIGSTNQSDSSCAIDEQFASKSSSHAFGIESSSCGTEHLNNSMAVNFTGSADVSPHLPLVTVDPKEKHTSFQGILSK